MTELYSRLKDRLSESEKAWIRKLLQNILLPLPAFGNLPVLAIAYGSDKFAHGYVEAYTLNE